MRNGIGFWGTAGIALTLVAGLLALLAAIAAFTGGREAAPGLFLLAGFAGSPGILLWRLGIDRQVRRNAVSQHVELINSTGVASLTALAQQVGYTAPESAWCVNEAIAQGLLPGKHLDLVHGVVTAAPVVRPPAPVSRPTPVQEDVDDDEPVAAPAHRSEKERIKRHLAQFGRLVHRRNCAHCDYMGRMGVTQKVDRTGTRLAGGAARAVMGNTPMARWLTGDLRRQRDQWEAICPSCEGTNYYDV